MKRTMSPEEEAEWEADMVGQAPFDIRPTTQNTHVTRKRAHTVEELWEKWATFGSKYPTRDGAVFLVWLEK